MYITNVRIRNFRGLEDIEFSPRAGINVLVGPNAVGKTSVLEAIRLTKALLAPRYRDETVQVLTSLGATTQHAMLFGAVQLDFGALAGVISSPLDVTLDIALSERDVGILNANIQGLVQALVRSRIGQERTATQLDLIQFMSSQEGRAQLQAAQKHILSYVEGVKTSKKITLGVNVQTNGQNLQINSKDTTAQLAFQTLEGACDPATALLVYFPADRALPSGEVNVQLGSADMQQQILSHLAQPAAKYGRLKQIIVNSHFLGKHGGEMIESRFNAIFGQLLPGKEFKGVQQKPTGNLSVLIKDVASGRLFDIDNMSSGEKGLILSFLLLQNGAARGGLALLDEPELHLNPAVCSRLIPFLHEQVVAPSDLQLFICTHSAEVLSSALHRDECSIFHLRTSKDVTPVDRRDKFELFEILRRLGLSSMDVVSWRGTIFVEGEEDIDLLSTGFADLLSAYQLKALGGRAEVEKEIQDLQQQEKKGDLQRLNVFIFDFDAKRTDLANTQLVRVLQWDRYCVENYLLDEGLLFDIVNRYAENKIPSKGELRNMLRNLAMEQLTTEVVRNAYAPLEPKDCGLRIKELSGQSIEQCAELLFDRIEDAKNAIAGLDRASWVASFVEQCKETERSLREEWETNWKKHCNAKQVFKALQARQKIKVALSQVKLDMIKEMKLAKSEDWRVMESLIVQSVKQ